MKQGPRARRRGDDQRMKSRAQRIMRLWAGRRNTPVDPRDFGVNASTQLPSVRLLDMSGEEQGSATAAGTGFRSSRISLDCEH